MEKFLKSVQEKHQTTKVCSISGSRDSESAVRARNLSKRGESAVDVVLTGLGWAQTIIKDWSLSDVWNLFKVIDDGDIESYSDNFDEMRKHYATGNGGACDLFNVGQSNNKECGARFGCVLCSFSEDDRSLEAQIDIDPKTYGFMKPLNDLRRYMINTLFNYGYRSRLGREMKDGWIKVGINQYSIEYRMNLLRYVLSIQQEAYSQHGYHPIDLIDIEELVAIQYHWSREGGETEPGMAFKIWHEVVNDDVIYPIPHTEKVEKVFTPEYLYFNLEEFMLKDNSSGLDDERLYSDFKEAARVYYKDGEAHQVVRFTENPTLRVRVEDARAMMFVESFYPNLVADGHLKDKCPTVMLKHLLESGVIEISKGSIDRVNRDAKRAQTLFSLRTNTGIPIEDAIQFFSVPKFVMDKMVKEKSLESNHSMQKSLF